MKTTLKDVFLESGYSIPNYQGLRLERKEF